jgi:WD40 repeat protein
VSALSFSPDGSRLAVGTFVGADHPAEVRGWDLVGGRELFRLRGHTGTVSGVAFSADGTRIASAALRAISLPDSLQVRDGEVKVWDADGRELLHLGWEPHSGAGREFSLAFSRDGSRLVLNEGGTGYTSDSLHVWDATPRAEEAGR